MSEVRAEDREGSLMSCKVCEVSQSYLPNAMYYYRWKNANIAIMGCKEHVREVMDALNRVQGEKKE